MTPAARPTPVIPRLDRGIQWTGMRLAPPVMQGDVGILICAGGA
jgi:hypothetical protein